MYLSLGRLTSQLRNRTVLANRLRRYLVAFQTRYGRRTTANLQITGRALIRLLRQQRLNNMAIVITRNTTQRTALFRMVLSQNRTQRPNVFSLYHRLATVNRFRRVTRRTGANCINRNLSPIRFNRLTTRLIRHARPIPHRTRVNNTRLTLFLNNNRSASTRKLNRMRRTAHHNNIVTLRLTLISRTDRNRTRGQLKNVSKVPTHRQSTNIVARNTAATSRFTNRFEQRRVRQPTRGHGNRR